MKVKGIKFNSNSHQVSFSTHVDGWIVWFVVPKSETEEVMKLHALDKEHLQISILTARDIVNTYVENMDEEDGSAN